MKISGAFNDMLGKVISNLTAIHQLHGLQAYFKSHLKKSHFTLSSSDAGCCLKKVTFPRIIFGILKLKRDLLRKFILNSAGIAFPKGKM